MIKKATTKKPSSTKTSKQSKSASAAKQSKLEIPTFLAAASSTAATKPTQPSPRKKIAPTLDLHTSKQDLVIAMMRRAKGSTIADLMEATGWQAHSVRGILSGVIRKRLGLPLISEMSADGVRHYRITKAVTA
jgi:Protein of unknown function (DUF3489)